MIIHLITEHLHEQLQGKFSYFFDIEIDRYFYLPDTQTSDDPKCEESKWISKPEFSGQARGFWGKTSDRTITGEDQSHSKSTTIDLSSNQTSQLPRHIKH